MTTKTDKSTKTSPLRRILRSALFVLAGAGLGYVGNLAYIQMGST